MTLPGVSIVIISHNEERNIADCLHSVRQLDYPPDRLETIVVDSSTDRTREIVRRYGWVKLLPSSHKSFSKKRNEGWRAARYDVVAFLDADCIAHRSWLAKLIPRLDDPQVGGAGCNAYPPPDSPFLGVCIACLGKPAGGAIGLDAEVDFLERGVSYLATCCTLFRKSVIAEVGGFDENLIYGNEDVDLSDRIRKAGHVLDYVPDAFVYHKTRNTLTDFLRWAYRRGKSHFHATRPRLGKLILEPFSALWLIVLVVVLALSPPRFLLWYGVLALLGLLLIAFLLFGGSLRRFFPTGSRKFRLLVERRQRIGISAGTILFCIIPLFYLDRLTVNLAQMWQKIVESSERVHKA